MSDIHYLFFGIASEYVLNPLYQYMAKQGHQCIEIDLLATSEVRPILKALKGKPVVFITSAHVFLDQYNLATIQQHDVEIISPLEIMDYLNPIKSFIMPHDLSTLFHDQDLPWLDLFDTLFVPVSIPVTSWSNLNVVDVGWIKRTTPVQPINENGPHSVGFALSDFTACIPLGPKKTYEIWEPILTQGVTIKFPYWHHDKEFEEYFRAQGAKVFSSQLSISEFIDMNSIIISNTFSSVNSEAAFAGREIINILNPGTAVLQKMKLGGLPNIRFMTIEECTNYISQFKQKNAPLKLVPPQIKPFDFELATKLIVQ
jgi:hypothetical protein